MAKVLIVDDEPVIQQLLTEVLRELDPDPLVAGTADDAVRLVSDAPVVEVALVDKNLPDRSGLRLIPDLKAAHPDVEVILMTAFATLNSAIEAMEAGAFDFLAKPFSDLDGVVLKTLNATNTSRLTRERRELFRQLKESEAGYRGLFEASSDAILVYDPDSGRVIDANPAAVRVYGFERSDLLGRRLAELRAESNGTGRMETIAPVIRKDRRKDGTTFPVEVSSAEFLRGGSRAGLEIIRDVSQRVAAEAQRAELEMRLMRAQKMEALGRLAGGVVHDFNNLLAVISTSVHFVSDRLREAPGFEEAIEDMQQIRAAVESAARLSRQLLVFSKRQVVTPEVLNVNHVVTEVEKLLRRTLGEDIELETDLAEKLWRVRMARSHLEQILANLALNARDAMPDGGRLSVRTANTVACTNATSDDDDTGDRFAVTLTVTDTGCGMPDDVVPRVFEPFFTTKGHGAGTGLGLATVYGIVEQARGTIQVTSTVGEGTTFTISLPATSQEASRRSLRPGRVHRAGSGETVLLVEDDDAVRGLTRRILERGGYVVIDAPRAETALEIHRAHSGALAVLLTDVVLPGMSGLELATLVQRERPGAKVLFMSGYAPDPAFDEQILDVGRAFLPKPFEPNQLLALVRHLLDSGPAGDAAPVSAGP